MYNVEYFNQPVAFNFGQTLVKIPGLDGSGKMGKSEGSGNAIFLFDEPEAIRKKVMKAVTDQGPTQENQTKPEVIQNLFTLMEVVSKRETIAFFNESYNKCQIRYGDLKKQLAEDMVAFIAPFREKILSNLSNGEYLSKVTRLGQEKAKESATKTVKEIREIIGFKHF